MDWPCHHQFHDRCGTAESEWVALLNKVSRFRNSLSSEFFTMPLNDVRKPT